MYGEEKEKEDEAWETMKLVMTSLLKRLIFGKMGKIELISYYAVIS